MIENNTPAVETTTTVVETATTEPVKVDVVSVLADKFKDNKALDKFKGKGVDDLFESYVNLESHIGKKVSEMPEDVVKQFLKVPAAPEKYLINEELDASIKEKITKVGVENNISQDQMKVISDSLIEIQRAKAEASTKETEAYLKDAQDRIAKEFGKASEERIADIKNLLQKYGSEDLNKEISQKGLLHNPEMVLLLDKISQDVLKHTAVGADFQQRQLTPAEAKEAVNKKLADKEFSIAYFNSVHPGHRQAVKEVNELLSITN